MKRNVNLDIASNTTAEMLVKNPNSAFSIWYGVDDNLHEFIKSLKKSKQQHIMLLVMEGKDDFAALPAVLSKMRYHYQIAIKYEKPKKDEMRSNTQTAFILSSKQFVVDPSRCSWFNSDVSRPTSLWDLSLNDNLISTKNDSGKESSIRNEIGFGQISYDAIVMMQQLSLPLPIERWSYYGPKNPSVVAYSKKVMPCNIVFK